MSSIYNVYTQKKDISLLQDFPSSDPHCHTFYSDGCVDLKTIVKLAKKRGFKVVMKADHDTTRGNRKLKKLCDDAGLICIPGIEISTNKGHMLGINVYDWSHKGRIDIHDAIDCLHRENSAAIVTHPWWRNSMREKVYKFKDLDGYEGLNGASPYGSLHFMRKNYPKPLLESLNIHKLPCWAGSDSHGGYIYGKLYTVFKTMDFSVDGIMHAIYKKNVAAVGPLLPLWSFLMDGVINQPVQLRNALFFS